ncbi:MAG: hypothetical protein WCI89_02735 [bacterium]
MATPELLQYIAQNKAAGSTQEQILAALRAAGWSEDVINDALFGTTSLNNPNTDTKPGTSTTAELARIQQELEQNQKRFHPHYTQNTARSPGIIGLLLQWYIVQSKNQANILLIAISLMSLGLSILLLLPKHPSVQTIPTTTRSETLHILA